MNTREMIEKAVDQLMSKEMDIDGMDLDPEALPPPRPGKDKDEDEIESNDPQELLRTAQKQVKLAAKHVDKAKKLLKGKISEKQMKLLDDGIANVLVIGDKSVQARLESVLDSLHEEEEDKEGVS